MREDLEFVSEPLKSNLGIVFETPVAHLIPQIPVASIVGDSSLLSCGGYLTTLKFWWHFLFPLKVITRTLLHLKDNSDKSFILINCLEYVTIILNYCASLIVFATQKSMTICIQSCFVSQTTQARSIGLSTQVNSRSSVVPSQDSSADSWWAQEYELMQSGLIPLTTKFRIRSWGSRQQTYLQPTLSPTTTPTFNRSTRSWKLAIFYQPSHKLFSLIWDILLTQLSQSKPDSEIETTQFKQAVYLRGANNMKITDPCGAEQAGYKQIVACFIKNLMRNHNSCSAMVRGYAKSIDMLFCLCNFPILADFLDQNNICTILISGREKEENIVRQHSPKIWEMFAALKTLGNESDINSPETAIAEVFTFIRVTGLRVAKYAQQTKFKIDVHK